MKENPSSYQDEITLRDLILKLKSFAQEIFKHWRIPAVCILLAMGYQAYTYFTYLPVYPTKITFSVDEDEGGSAAGLTGILGQFGLAAARPSRYNLDKILALVTSRRVIGNTLRSRVSIDGKEDYLANHLIREYRLKPAHKKDMTSENEESFFSHDSLPLFNRVENEMLISLYYLIIGPENKPKKALVTADYNEDTNIMSLSVSTTDESLSIALAQNMFQSLSDYYINKAIEKQLKTYRVVSAKRDSVLTALKAAEYQLANFRDTHRGMLMRTDQLTELRLQREIAALSAMYVEVLKNTEVADFTLKNKLPFIQVIDSPLPPIQPALFSLPRKLLIGLIIGGVLGCVLVGGRKIIRDSLAVQD